MSTASSTLAVARGSGSSLSRDFSELIKLRVTSLIVMTAWAGYFMASARMGVSSVGWGLLHALLGIGLVSGGTAALNEIVERDVDALMRRTAGRPLPAKRMTLTTASLISATMIGGGLLYLALATNVLTAVLTAATSGVYMLGYTPLKRVSPICTFIGALPGAMPPLLGWVAARGAIDAEGIALFAILFCWQFPHFYAIAWMYREDYASANIRMLPVIEQTGTWTRREIICYSLTLIPATMLPVLMHMAGRAYLGAAMVLGGVLLWYAFRASSTPPPMSSPESRIRARNLLKATVIYLPLLLAAMMLNAL
ncbi:MAG: heme o synthase [Terriglobales bacterium]